jgi:protein O-mannosyl-transferase
MPELSAPAGSPARRPIPQLSLEGHALACGVVLAICAVATYRGTFSVPLLFDDAASVTGNPTLRHFASVFWPPSGTTVSGRPVLNLSLALNYAISGSAVWSYHALNLAIHVLAGLTLFGIVRRTLVPRVGHPATAMGFAVALLWTLHPLLTESVTYIVQRAESLMGLFYLLTLYLFILGAGTEGAGRRMWYMLSIIACLLGMGTKEVMVSAPLIVLLYDRTFLAGSFKEAIRRRRWVYCGLAATWVFLGFLVLGAHGRNGSAGFGSGLSWWSYALTQPSAIVRYLHLSLWPQPLIFDYGRRLALHPSEVLPCAAVVGTLVAATLWALVRRPAMGFLGAVFFALLAPSSSVVPVATEAMAEHRMYLSLVPVVVLVVAGIYRWLGPAAMLICIALAAALSSATLHRNETYRSAESIWRDTVDKCPGNERAQENLGFALAGIPGRSDEAITHYEEALRLKPDYVEAHNDLAYLLLNTPGRLSDAVSHYEAALRIDPNLAEVHFNLARALQETPGRSDEALAHYGEAIRLKPDYVEAHYNLGYMLQSIPGRLGDAARQFEETLRLKPDDAGAHFSLGCALQAEPGRLNDAIAHFKEAVRLRPDFVEARCNLGNTLDSEGRVQEAIAQYAEAVRQRPADASIRTNFAIILLKAPGRSDEAIAQLREALRLQPPDERARRILERMEPSHP